VPDSERDRPLLEPWQIVPAEDTDHMRRVSKRRDAGEQLRLDRLAGDEQVSRLDPGRDRCIDEVLTLGYEQPELLPLPSALELPDELQPRVGRGGNQLESAALACSAILPNAAGSATARSARILRSSSISALRQPATNWL
jgi:hypothetical protein